MRVQVGDYVSVKYDVAVYHSGENVPKVSVVQTGVTGFIVQWFELRSGRMQRRLRYAPNVRLDITDKVTGKPARFEDVLRELDTRGRGKTGVRRGR